MVFYVKYTKENAAFSLAFLGEQSSLSNDVRYHWLTIMGKNQLITATYKKG
jgi:hypothetical protein